MIGLKVGILLAGARPIGEGINGALRGFALIGNDEIPIIVKYLSDRELLCEILCAQMGREINLPIPEPVLIFDENRTPMFGSTDIGYPNLSHYLEKESESEIVIEKLKNWVHLQSASFFDELIFNADRHPGNLLYDGAGFHLIDHGLTLHASYPPETLPNLWNNQLFSLAISLCSNDIQKCKLSNSGAVWTESFIDGNVINNTTSSLSGDTAIIESLSNFLSVRQNLLKSMINMRIGASQVDYINA